MDRPLAKRSSREPSTAARTRLTPASAAEIFATLPLTGIGLGVDVVENPALAGRATLERSTQPANGAMDLTRQDAYA